MTFTQIALLVLYAFGMAAGQMMFKATATGLKIDSADALLRLAFNPMFIAAVVIYGGLSFLWVWLLSIVPLSRAYPFVAISLAAVPLAAFIFFHEPMTTRLMIGIVVICVGAVLVAG